MKTYPIDVNKLPKEVDGRSTDRSNVLRNARWDSMITELRRACGESLKFLYPAGVPDELTKRLAREMKSLIESDRLDILDDFLLFKELSDAAKGVNCKLYLAGVDANSIFIYLLGDHELNPMPAHYYCPDCGFYREEPTTVVGMDLPEKDCPECGKPLRKDGFSLREEFVWAHGRVPCFEYRAPARFYGIAQRVVEKHYASQNRVAALCGWGDERATVTECGWLILPEGFIFEDYQPMPCVTQEGRECLFQKRSGSLFFDNNRVRSMGLKRVLFTCSELLNRLDAAQWKTGVFLSNIPNAYLTRTAYQEMVTTDILPEDVWQVLNCRKPMTFREIADSISATHNTWESTDNKETASFLTFSKSSVFENCPICTRDDVFDFLCSVYDDTECAFLDTEKLYMGRCTRSPKQCICADMPDYFRRFAECTAYLFPRAFGQWHMLQYMRLAFYSNLNYSIARQNTVNRQQCEFRCAVGEKQSGKV